jgi:arabinogalactan oligomer/maltooligosaccharide transport system substrate-binding protein
MSLSKLTKFLPLMMVVALVLAACTSASPGESAGESEAAPAASEATFPSGDIAIELWTKEGDPNIEFVQQLADDYKVLHPNVTITVVNKDVELLREDMVNTALAPETQPELLWTVLDHVGPLYDAGVIQPLTGQFDESVLADATKGAGTYGPDGDVWVAPISIGNQLMLYYNKSLVADAPADTDAMIAAAEANTSGDNYGLVYNQTEPFWLVPWLGGFGGSVFADDGVTPTLDTDEMKATLQFLSDLKTESNVMPSECDYDCAHALFLDGSAAMIINGDWVLADYTTALGDDLGVTSIPTVTATGEDPKPYIGGTYWMVPSAVEGDTLTVVLDFIDWTLAADQQDEQVQILKRLPANDEILTSSVVTDDASLADAAAAVALGIPQPINAEMRCNWDAMKPQMQAVLSGSSSVADAAAAMQTAADNCIATLQ